MVTVAHAVMQYTQDAEIDPFHQAGCIALHYDFEGDCDGYTWSCLLFNGFNVCVYIWYKVSVWKSLKKRNF